MPNPQQPDLAPLPDEQRPGHHPEHDQDKPPLDALAERLGVPAEGDEPHGAPGLTVTGPDADADEPLIITTMRKRRRVLALAIALPAAGFVVVRRILRR